MTVMNRLSPLIVRKPAGFATRSAARAMDWQNRSHWEGADAGKYLDELKLFATGWIGGLIFFGTYLG